MALRQIAVDNADGFSAEAIKTISRNFYVDDCLKCPDNIDDACSLPHELVDLCSRGGFRLTQWSSNSESVIQLIPVEERAKEIQSLDLAVDKMPTDRALGVAWQPDSDSFTFDVKVKDRPATRRGILSSICSIYDPMSFISPFVLPARALLQSITRRKPHWDDPVTESEQLQWQQCLDNLSQLSSISVSRSVRQHGFGQIAQCEIHNFSDASQIGYGVASYMRLVNENGDVCCSLIHGKSRVVPLKSITIPRLELAAATLSVRLNNMLMKEIDLKVDNVYFWSDSTIVLCYIRNESSRFRTYVANRVQTIRSNSSVDQWRYVDTKSNPADIASRGLCFKDESSVDKWFNGPQFLYGPQSEWPELVVKSDSESLQCDPESKNPASCVMSSIDEKVVEKHPVDLVLERISSWKKIKAVVALVSLAVQRFKTPRAERKPCELTIEALESAESLVLKHVQSSHFPELGMLNHGTRLKKSSSILRLDPFVESGVLRVGGRLARAMLPYDTKHPVIVPKESVLAKRLIEHVHRKIGHFATEAILAELRRQGFWLVQAGKLIRRFVSHCVRCRKYNGRFMDQKMADLPMERLVPNEPPFTRSAVDYFGPFEIKRGRVVEKRYGVIFTCLASRAIHLESAHSLETSSCIQAFRRFISRRGEVKFMRSDNGINLVGAERELREGLVKLDQKQIFGFLQGRGIDWQFNPPAASHFGGVWERLIRSVRKVLYMLMKEQVHKLSDESFSTLLCEVEAILNSRPITKVSKDPNDLEALTPNHLLYCKPGQSLPPGLFTKSDNYPVRYWRQVQYLADIFWGRWLSEYLPLLQTRQKWFFKQRNATIGDVVLIADSSVRNSWVMGKVKEVREDKTGFVRSVVVKTAHSELARPVDKIVLLLEGEE